MIPNMDRAVTEDALLGGRVRLLQPQRGYRIAIDAVLLAAAVEAGPRDHVLDLGAGVGAVGLCVAARLPGCRVTGIELQPALAALAERNAALNGVADRVTTRVHDLATPLPADLPAADVVATNPPYLAAAVADPSPDPSKALATVESSADLARWLAVAVAAAKPAGTLLVIHRSDRLDEILRLIRLDGKRHWKAGLLAHGEKQWLEIGMLLAQEPKVLLVDEPAAGMTDEETHRTGELLLSLAGRHSLIVVEHDMTFVKQIARQGTVTVLHQGTVLCEGKFDEVQADQKVREVYLGRGKHGTR